MAMDGGVNGDEFLQTSHTTKAQHRPFPSPKRLVRILTSVVHPAPGFLLVRITDDLHRSAIRTQFIRYHNMRQCAANVRFPPLVSNAALANRVCFRPTADLRGRRSEGLLGAVSVNHQ